jgi:soluble lytic murein transglycosylase-like protein
VEDIVLLQTNPKQLAELRLKRDKLRGMEKDYDQLVKDLGIYGKMSEEDRLIIKTAHALGECELNVPKGFTSEVKNYVRRWKSSDRLETAINRAKQKGYAPIVSQALSRYELPPHFFFLAIQESGFKEDAVGPRTRFGYAKGIWQLVPTTAKSYGLKVGPLFERSAYDSHDERFNFEMATKAAAGYLRDISNTEAQASGLLVMASYNWGENNTRKIIRQMPENPRDRNFWRFLAIKNIPQETYDYVFYIFSAAVICENPRLFGFDFECPVMIK